MSIAALVTVTGVVYLLCRICGKRTRHTVSQSSKFYRDYRCEACHIITKYKVE